MNFQIYLHITLNKQSITLDHSYKLLYTVFKKKGYKNENYHQYFPYGPYL